MSEADAGSALRRVAGQLPGEVMSPGIRPAHKGFGWFWRFQSPSDAGQRLFNQETVRHILLSRFQKIPSGQIIDPVKSPLTPLFLKGGTDLSFKGTGA